MRIWRTMGVLVSFSLCAMAQDAAPKFDVASIKPSAPGGRGMFIRPMPGGRLNVTNMTLKELIVLAYQIQPFQVSGGPAWFDSARYDIAAKPENPVKQSEWHAMLQALLADRFQLAFHREKKDVSVYALVLARKDGKLGPGLTESKEGGCTMPDPSKPPSMPEPGKAPALGCGNFMMGPGRLTVVAVPVANMILPLSRMLGRTILDKTGLTGKYDIKLNFSPDDSQVAMLAPPGAPPPNPSSDASGPSLFTALQEQLGLKLESQKGPVELFIIDRAEKPSEN